MCNRKLFSQLLIPLFGGVALSLTSHAYDTSHRLDPQVEEIMASWHLPGLAVAVVKDDKVVFARGYGIRELGSEDVVDEHTIFGIGSSTKSFATASTALVVDDGKANWDDPVVNHLPWYRLYDPWTTQHVTIRDVASHKVGAESTLVWAARTWGRWESLKRMRHLKPVFDFRTGFMYSNLGMMTLGAIVEEHAGQSWEDTIHQRILKPLGMKRTFLVDHQYVQKRHMAPCWVCEPAPGYIQGKAALRRGYENTASPHGLHGGEKLRIVPWRYDDSGPAGSMASTALDMAQWLRLHLNEGEYEGLRIISADQMWQMHHAQNGIPGSKPDLANPPAAWEQGFNLNSYGFGWWVRSYRGQTYVTHGGGQVGGGAMMVLLPAQNVGVVVIQNANWREVYAFDAVARLFVDHYLGLEPLDWNKQFLKTREIQARNLATAAKQLNHQAKAAGDPALPLAAYTGKFESALLGPITVSEQNGKLFVTFDVLANADMQHLGNNRFMATFRDPMVWRIGIRFEPEMDGRVISGTLGGLGGIMGEYAFQRVDQ